MRKKSPQLAKIAEYKFRPLKKNLQRSFKKLQNCKDSNQLPDQSAVSQFLDEVTLMVSYSGFGDEYYQPFKDACEQLTNIIKSGNLETFKEQVTTINSLKKQCHNRFRY